MLLAQYGSPTDWDYNQYGYEAVDTPKVMGVKYIGAQASGLVTVTATTGDLVFTHGVLASEVADTTVGGTGTLDLTTYTTIQKVIRAINLSANWEAWPIDLPGDYLTNISAGNGIFTAAGVAAAQAKVAAGLTASFVVDTSLKTAEDFGVGITYNGPSSNIHNKDAGVIHHILKINANVTFGGATDGLYIYECNDRDGTKTQVWHRPLVTATATEWTNNGVPIISTVGRRFCVMAKDASGAITVPSILIEAASYKYMPAYHNKWSWASQSI